MEVLYQIEDVLDHVVLKSYKLFPTSTRHMLEDINDAVMQPDAASDSPEPDHECYVLKGNLKEVLSALHEEMRVLSVELPKANAMAVVKIMEAVKDHCPNVKVLKVARNCHAPDRPSKRVEKELVKVLRKYSSSCHSLKYLNIKDVVVTRPIYDTLSEMSNISKLGISAAWPEIEAKECRSDRLMEKMMMHPKMNLLDFKGYGKARGPSEDAIRMFAKKKASVLIGLSGSTTSGSLNWVFQLKSIRYLDLDVEDVETMSRTKQAYTWGALQNLSHLKLSSKTITGIPPLRRCDKLTHLILDVKIPDDQNFNDWVEERMPLQLEVVVFTKVGKGKIDMLQAFRNYEELKLLYIGYHEDGSPAIGTSDYPPNLEYFIVFEKNNPDSESIFYDAAAANIQQTVPGLRLKINGFESPLSSVLWPSMWRRLEHLLTRPVVFDFAVPCFMHHMFRPSDLCGTGAQECPCVPPKV